MNRRISVSVLIVLTLVSLPMYVQAQQAAAYQTRFDDGNGWEFSEFYGVQWGVDANPIGGYSPSNSLNYNNGTDYATGDYVYGLAFSPEIPLSGHPSATLRFRCRYQTEDPSQNPFGREADVRFLMVMDAAGEILMSNQLTSEACGEMDAWHEHDISLNPSWGTIRLILYFDSIDELANDYQGWFIDDLAVNVPDNMPPAAVTNLAAGNPSMTSMLLTWTAPTDNDTSGAAASFDIRYSTSTITLANFATAVALSGEPSPGIGGTPHQLTVSGLSAGTTYYFALRTTDKSGNVSVLSNVASGTTSAIPTQPQVTTSGSDAEEKEDRVAMCGASSASSAAGVVGLVSLVILAFVLRRNP